ncbi:Diphthamide biosynthesis protein 4 [Lunasporangiospora selenospora]|uniref:Diphthamide biosynthesis protein 4 n=1 Tax=Lunasporangiospora selenospora TaxID=979761 RepID=A0A9P6G0Y3_9FUNG|nr:Diphthamide biosynthesis protein 4 [Lunasporangiospora selenospora]
MLKDYYEILGVPQEATLAEIKQQYQRLLLTYHPDKQQQNLSQKQSVPTPVRDTTDPLLDVREAWECLREPSRREFYDSSLKGRHWLNRFSNVFSLHYYLTNSNSEIRFIAMKLRAQGQVNDDIDLDDMEFDEEAGIYSFPCRCSGEYAISEDELELGIDTVTCSTCSLIVLIHYEVADDA